jgi:hypothetical protein
MDVHRHAKYKCEQASLEYAKFHNLQWYRQDRQTRLDFLKSSGKVSFDAVMGFEMFFDESACSKVFFLDMDMKEIVYVHDSSPYPRVTAAGNFDIQSAGDVKAMHDEFWKLGMISSQRRTPSFKKIGQGKRDNFWVIYGVDAVNTLPDEGEVLGPGVGKEINNPEVARIARMFNKQHRKRKKEDADVLLTPRAVPLRGEKSHSESETFIPFLKKTEEEWDYKERVESGGEFIDEYSELRESRSKHVDGKIVRGKDRVLREGLMLRITNWKDLVEEDEVHFSMIQHYHSCKMNLR